MSLLCSCGLVGTAEDYGEGWFFHYMAGHTIIDQRLVVRPVGYDEARAFIAAWHYSVVMPVLTHLVLGGFRGQELLAVSTWGWGVRPLHTIKKLFPSLGPQDYWELGKLCVHDSEPRNTESAFLADCAAYIHNAYPWRIKLLFTWADGILGKPGYVYQAAGWLYGGFITTDTYITKEGEKVHPRTFQSKTHTVGDGLKYGKRPTAELCESMGWRQIFGKQFRYARFLCSNGERKRLLRESSVQWSQDYPKAADMDWRQRAGQGSRVSCERPTFTGAVRFRSPAPLFDTEEEQ